MRTIEFVEKDKRRLKAHQSLCLIAPLARRHGLGAAAEELSALSSSVLRAGPGVSAHVAAPDSRCPSEEDQATSRLIRAAASILPRSQRDDWIAEWEGELGAIRDQEGRQRFVRNALLRAAPAMALRRAPYRSRIA